MNALKWRKRLLAGLLCAAMVFQNLSVSAFASEQDIESVEEDEYSSEENLFSETAENETIALENMESVIVESETGDTSREDEYNDNMTADEEASPYAETSTAADSESPKDPTENQKSWTLGIDKPTLTIDNFTKNSDKGNDKATVTVRSLENLSDEDQEALKNEGIQYEIEQRPTQKSEDESNPIEVISVEEDFTTPLNGSSQMKIKAENAGKAVINVTIGTHTKSIVVTVKNIDIEWNYVAGSTTLVTLDGLTLGENERPPYWDESKKTTTIRITSGADLMPENIIYKYNLTVQGEEQDREKVVKVSNFTGPFTDKDGKYYEATVEAVTAGISEISITIGNITRKITFVVEEIDSIVFDQHNLNMTNINSLAEVHLTIVPIARWKKWVEESRVSSGAGSTETPDTETSSGSQESSGTDENSSRLLSAKTLLLAEEAPEIEEGFEIRELAETAQTPDSSDNFEEGSNAGTEEASGTEESSSVESSSGTEESSSVESSSGTEGSSSVESSSDSEESSGTEESSDTGGSSGPSSSSGVVTVGDRKIIIKSTNQSAARVGNITIDDSGVNIQLIATGNGKSNIVASLQGEGTTFTDICAVTVGTPSTGDNPDDDPDEEDPDEDDPDAPIFDEDANIGLIIEPYEARENPYHRPIEFEEDAKQAHQINVDAAAVSDDAKDIWLIARRIVDGNEVTAAQDENWEWKWDISDKSIATIDDKQLAPNKALLSLKKGVSGTATITATVTVNREGAAPVTYKAQMMLSVRDYTPILDENTYTLHKYGTEGAVIPLYAANGNKITGYEIWNNTEERKIDERFVIRRVSGKYRLLFANQEARDSFVTNTKIKAVLKVRTEKGNDPTFDINIAVNVTVPKTTFKAKTKANLFYTDTTATFKVTSTEKILTIANVENPATTGFVVKDYNSATGILTVKAVNLTSNTLNDFSAKESDLCRVSFDIFYDGYEKQTISVAVPTQNVKPSYSVNEIYPFETTKVDDNAWVVDNKTKKKVLLTANYTVGAVLKVTPKTETVRIEKNGSYLKVKYSGEKKSVSYQVELSNAKEWTSSIVLKGKISKKKRPTTVLDKKSVILNMEYNAYDNEDNKKNRMVKLDVSAKNNPLTINGITVEGANDKSKALLSENYLQYNLGTNKGQPQLELILNNSNRGNIKVGSYKFNVVARIGEMGSDQGTALEKTTLTIKLVDKAPDIKLSAKGSINLIDRENTSILYTPKISNATASIQRIQIKPQDQSQEYRDFFTAQLTSDGKIEIKAAKGKDMSTAIRYPIVLTITLDNGFEKMPTIYIKPKNKLPNIKASTSKATLYKSAGNSESWTIDTGDFGEIKGITIVENNKTNANFTLTDKGNGSATIRLKSAARKKLKPGKYTVSYQVAMKDAAINSNPKTLKMTITVK